eukprot:345584_1
MSYQKIVYSIKEYRVQHKRKLWNETSKRIMHRSGHVTDIQNRPTFEETAHTIKTSPLLHHLICTTLLFAANVTLAMYITDLGVALNMVGSVASVSLIFVLPALFHWKSTHFTFKFWEYPTWKQRLEACIAIYG